MADPEAALRVVERLDELPTIDQFAEEYARSEGESADAAALAAYRGIREGTLSVAWVDGRVRLVRSEVMA